MEKALISIMDWWESAGLETGHSSLDTPAKTQNPSLAGMSKSNKASKNSRSRGQVSQAGKSASVNTHIDTDADQSQNIKARLETAQVVAKQASSLGGLQTAMQAFDAGDISDHARQCVFARGNAKADIMLIDTAPDKEDDIQGKPLTGQAGDLLGKMLHSIGLTDEDVYITHMVNWRPPENRAPTQDEINMCRPFLDRHIEFIAPKIIALIGATPLSALTGITGIMKNRGQWQILKANGKELPALPIFHPAFLLKRPELKKEAWRDLLALRAKIQTLL